MSGEVVFPDLVVRPVLGEKGAWEGQGLRWEDGECRSAPARQSDLNRLLRAFGERPIVPFDFNPDEVSF